MRKLYLRSLQGAGFDVVVADGGPEGLQKLKEDPDIRLVLLDLNMPGMDGWGFREVQRADPQLKDVPTVIVTGEPLARVVQQELHATQYLLKPIRRDYLISVVSEYCSPTGW